MKKFDISDELQNKPSAHAKGSDVRVHIASHEKKQSTVLGLLDTGASNNFITKETLKHVDHTTTAINSCVNGRYSKSNISQKPIFHIRLPDFTSSKTIKITALVEDNTAGRHNIMFGTPFLRELGFHFDYQRGIITWDDVSMVMQSIPRKEHNNIDLQDEHLPDFLKTITNKQNVQFRANVYGKYKRRRNVMVRDGNVSMLRNNNRNHDDGIGMKFNSGTMLLLLLLLLL